MEGLLNKLFTGLPSFSMYPVSDSLHLFVWMCVLVFIYKIFHFPLLCFLFSTKELSAISVDEMAETDVLLACNN